MPSSIPYDPSLVLANVVGKDALTLVQEIADFQAKIDAPQEELNSFISMRRSLDMTKTELLNLGVSADDIKKIDDELKDVNKNITDAAVQYAQAKIENEKEIRTRRANIRSVHVQVESPVDYVKSQIKSMPLAADSVNMDVQYFSMDTNEQNSGAFAKTISSFVAVSTSVLGSDASTKLSAAAQNQVSSQTSKHSIAGTLVLSVACTHKNASVLAPFVLNVDKGIKVWNSLFPGSPIDPTSTKAMLEIAGDRPKDLKTADKFSIISGTTFGSSFVGMVHVLNTTETTASESLSSVASSLQAQMDKGAWLAKVSGEFGVNSSISNDVKNLLSTQNVTSHVTMVCMGAIPSVVASEVKLGVEKFANFDPKSNLEAIATIHNATTADQGSVQQSAEASRTGQQMVAMKSGDIKAALTALADIDDGANKILDINSMMTALDDYLKKAADGTAGIPINYYLKDITKDMLAEMWVAKYYPGKYMAIKYDDSTDDKNQEDQNQDENAGDN